MSRSKPNNDWPPAECHDDDWPPIEPAEGTPPTEPIPGQLDLFEGDDDGTP
jgi:hypothetical protein